MAMNVVRVPPRETGVKNTFVTVTSLGSNEVIAAVAGRRIRVVGLAVITTLANAVKFMSAATDISATLPLGANGGVVLPFNEHGWFQTSEGEALNINLGTATSTGVQVVYQAL